MSEQSETPATDSVQDRLTVSVRRHGGAGVVALAGELDHDTAPTFADAALALADEGVAHLVIDCSALRFCDSTGLNVLLKARLRTVDDGGRFVLAGVGPQLRRLLELTGADGVFETRADVAAALSEDA
ncbi:anti-anti-sigma factor [Streptacidiphilus sp. MAP12-33]|uniref:STAS domain-containing protein n=1 Tax=Streptacidiphilus sp. MAP12-33 TaxID=3156266 RepID=UPI003515653B